MENSNDIILFVFSGAAVTLLLVVSIFLFVMIYNRKMHEKQVEYELNLLNKESEILKAIIETQEEERSKIARNLHDEVGPLVSTLKHVITKNERRFNKGEPIEDGYVKEKEMTDLIMENVRRVSHELSPIMLQKFGLINAMKRILENLNIEKTIFEANFEDDQFLVETSKVNLYRIYLEVINNIVKYDKPTSMFVNLSKEPTELLLTISHNGEGITNDEFLEMIESGQGLGLESIRRRLMLMKGNITYAKFPATIELIIPYINEQN